MNILRIPIDQPRIQWNVTPFLVMKFSSAIKKQVAGRVLLELWGELRGFDVSELGCFRNHGDIVDIMGIFWTPLTMFGLSPNFLTNPIKSFSIQMWKFNCVYWTWFWALNYWTFHVFPKKLRWGKHGFSFLLVLSVSTNGKWARWFGFLGSPFTKGLLQRGTPGISNHRAPNHQFTISWVFVAYDSTPLRTKLLQGFLA